MNMKISNSTIPLPFAHGLDGKARSLISNSGGNNPSTATVASASGEHAGTSSTQLNSSTRLNSISTMANAPIDASKLAEIKQAIRAGLIQINSSAVSENLIKSVNDLISTQ